MSDELVVGLIGLFGVIIGAFVASANEYWKERRDRDRNASYLAIRVISLLDGFVESCTEVAVDDGLNCGERDSHGYRVAQTETPDFFIRDIDVDWKSIDSEFLYRILNFPNLIDLADQKIASVIKYVSTPPDFEEVFEERQFQYSSLGLNASLLADDLRKAFGLPSRELDDWNPIGVLQRCQDEILQLRKSRIPSP